MCYLTVKSFKLVHLSSCIDLPTTSNTYIATFKKKINLKLTSCKVQFKSKARHLMHCSIHVYVYLMLHIDLYV